MKHPTLSIAACRIALLALVLAAPATQAFTYDVTTTADLADEGGTVLACHISGGGCSLRSAIMKSNQNGESNIINVPAGTYTLTIPASGVDGDDVGDLNITGMMAIVGQGKDITIIDANHIDRVVDIAVGQFVSFTGVSIRNGGRRGDGGGIRNAGLLTLNGCTVEGNVSETSGTDGDGGGIYSSGVLSITDSVIRSNIADNNGSGGGIAAYGATTIRGSTISGNSALYGGGIHIAPASAFVYFVNSTLSGNSAQRDGGGVHAFGSASTVVALYSSSVIGNDASHNEIAMGVGGGISAGGVTGSRFQIINTIIGNNTVFRRNAFNDCDGSIEAYGFNLFSLAVPPGCTIGGNGSAAWGEVFLPSIGPLADNQGPTPTHALLQNSEAINATTSQGCIDENGILLSTDQRGAPRTFGFRCDVGAYEYGSVVDLIFSNGYD